MRGFLAVLLIAACTCAVARQSSVPLLKQAEKAMGLKALKNISYVIKTHSVIRVDDRTTGKY